jgi:hypothetical protein
VPEGQASTLAIVFVQEFPRHETGKPHQSIVQFAWSGQFDRMLRVVDRPHGALNGAKKVNLLGALFVAEHACPFLF